MWSLDFTAKIYTFEIIGAASFSFNIDVTPLTVSLLPIETEVVANSGVAEIALNFTLSEVASKISYVVDGNCNATIVGNTTLSGISVGKHNLTVYVWDAAGNVGASETITFTIAEPFPTTLLIVSAVAVVAVVGLGLLVYFKKSHRDKST